MAQSVSELGDSFKRTQNLTWKEIQELADKENKAILIDCFTTWCKPCHKMDKETFSDSTVQSLLQQNFICTKVQMDKTSKDKHYIKSWYKTAEQMSVAFDIAAYPTLVIMNSKGKIVNKIVGFHNSTNLLAKLNASISLKETGKTPDSTYLMYLKQFKSGILHKDSLFMLFFLTKNHNDLENSVTLKDSLLKSLRINQSFNFSLPDAIRFVSTYLKDLPEFESLFVRNERSIDSSIKLSGFASYIVDSIIQSRYAMPFIESLGIDNGEPQWQSFEDSISKNFDIKYTHRNLLWAKIRWHEGQAHFNKNYKGHQEYKQLFFDYIDIYSKSIIPGCGTLGDLGGHINHMAWEAIFKRSDATEVEYTTTLQLLRNVLEIYKLKSGRYPLLVIDTYANLIYKYAYFYKSSEERKLMFAQAMDWESLAVQLADQSYKNLQLQFARSYMKMLDHVPTW
jgi:thioredoxin-related protein